MVARAAAGVALAGGIPASARGTAAARSTGALGPMAVRGHGRGDLLRGSLFPAPTARGFASGGVSIGIPSGAGGRILREAGGAGAAVDSGAPPAALPYKVAGFSVSPTGFVCFLAPEGSSLVVADALGLEGDKEALVIHMSRTEEDSERASSLESLSLLQLAEDIDMGIRLPYHALFQVCEGLEEGAGGAGWLDAALIEETGEREGEGGAAFKGRLMVGGSEYDTDKCFELLALSMRYKSPLFVRPALVGREGVPLGSLRGEYPALVPMEELQQQAERITDHLATAFKCGDLIGEDDVEMLRRQMEEREKGA